MANIHIARNQQSLGSFGEEEVREGIRTGRFAASDLAWREGMTEWKRLGEMAPQWGMELPSPESLTALPENPPSLPVGESGPAWEERESLGLFPAILQTVQEVLTRPVQTFAAMKRTGGLANPLLYFVLLGSAMFAVSMLYQMAAAAYNPAFLPKEAQHLPKNAIMVVLLGAILISPALYVLSAFISSGITHLSLKLVGGANRPFETTFRVICYAQASAAVFNLLPVCGGIIGGLLAIYCVIIGLREAHGTQGWRAALGFFLPLLVCCGIFLALGVMVPMLAYARTH